MHRFDELITTKADKNAIENVYNYVNKGCVIKQEITDVEDKLTKQDAQVRTKLKDS